jgi:subtilisin-like proprotein convertase family protein
MYCTGQSQIWQRISENTIQLRSAGKREIIPTKYLTYRLDQKMITENLSLAPLENDIIRKQNNYTLSLPLPDGSMTEFVVWNSQVMEEELSARYPSIKSYKGYQKDNRNVTARFGTGPNGFHAAVRTEEGMIYIDPYSTGDTDYYIVYNTSDQVDQSLRDRVFCGTDEASFMPHRHTEKVNKRTTPDKIELRKYRLALGCTGEWGAVRGTKEKALADMVVFVDRANVVFEAEVALRAVLIARNDELIYLDGNVDQYNNSTEGLKIVGENTNILNRKIGFANYDIGHVFSICFDVGGVAAGVICSSGKGAGVTCHNSSQINSGIVLVFNHEVGHQMTASHTFNHCGSTDQLALGTAYEPGSGSTILGYPGACGNDNLPAGRDDYYHGASLEQILSYTNSDASDAYICAEKVDINNHLPVITLPYSNGFSIPRETPFFLKGSAVDQDNDKLTFNWDQFDNGTSSPLGSPMGNAPLFRSLKPTTSPARYFPNVSRILSGQFKDVSELLPTYGRDLTFRFIVRDNNPLGNAAVWQEMNFKVAGNAGPFRITYPALDYKWKIGEQVLVTWDVSNTDIEPVNCKYVDIYVAYNNSLDFESNNLILVSKATPNDGSEPIIIPNREGLRARIVIKASNNIFFAIGQYNSRIDIPTNPAFFMDVNETYKKACLPEIVNFNFSTVGFAGMTDKIKFEIASGLPANAVATFAKDAVDPGETNGLVIDLRGVKGTAVYDVKVRSYAEGIDTIERILRLELTGTDLDFVSLVNPVNGLSGVGPTQKYDWDVKEDAIIYDLEVATSPAFKPNQIVIKTSTANTNFSSNTFLEKATIYYWRVKSSNACRAGEWSDIFAFNTEALSCSTIKSGDLSINISGTGTPKVEAKLEVFNEGIISDLNIRNIKGDHQWVGDLVAYLVSPSGKEVTLWTRKCGSSKGFNVGFDDQSNEYVNCPINTSKIYIPEQPLSSFNGEDMKGTWTLRLEDRALGNGGKLQTFNMELCANIVLSPPFITRNEILKIHPKDSKTIDRTLLLSEDNDNKAEELKYILVSAPSKGILTVNGTPASAGSEFTQADIDRNKISYLHIADNEEDDFFRFVVTDGQGGWVRITDFVIQVNAETPIAVNDLIQDERILIYPNPAADVLNINLLDKHQDVCRGVITDITGRVLQSFNTTENVTSLDIQYLSSGVYIISIGSGAKPLFRKFIKQ